MKVKDKVAVVTGGADGIGEAICRRMAFEGASVIIADIADEKAEKVERELKSSGNKAIALHVDVTKSRETDQMINVVLEKFGKVDILVNNAGGSHPQKNIQFCESNEEAWDWTIDLNLKGMRNCTRAVINHMIERKSGKIVSIASISGVTGTLTKVDYSAAKAGVIGFTKALAKEVAPHGINVNCVSPGPIATPLFLSNKKEFQEVARQAVYLKRVGKPEEIANMVLFLASDEASFIVGQNFIVDGGRIL